MVFFSVKAVTKEKGVSYSLHLLWMALNLKQVKFGFNIKKSFLVVNLLNQGVGLPG